MNTGRTMWHYLLPHLIYHSSSYLWRRKMLLVPIIGLMGVLMVAPQVWIMNIYDFYVMYCPLPIYKLMVFSLFLSIASLSFSVYFLIREHLPRFGRHLFHTFGLVDFVFETLFIYYTKRASVCVTTAEEMYIICYILSVCAVLSTDTEWTVALGNWRPATTFKRTLTGTLEKGSHLWRNDFHHENWSIWLDFHGFQPILS